MSTHDNKTWEWPSHKETLQMEAVCVTFINSAEVLGPNKYPY